MRIWISDHCMFSISRKNLKSSQKKCKKAWEFYSTASIERFPLCKFFCAKAKRPENCKKRFLQDSFLWIFFTVAKMPPAYKCFFSALIWLISRIEWKLIFRKSYSTLQKSFVFLPIWNYIWSQLCVKWRKQKIHAFSYKFSSSQQEVKKSTQDILWLFYPNRNFKIFFLQKNFLK